jgi:protease-4
MKGILKWFIGFIAAFGFIFLFLFIIITAMLETEPVVPDSACLNISLSGDIAEYTAPDQIEDALGHSKLDMKKIRDNLEKARVDERIKGVILHFNMLETGFAKIQELRELIAEFRKSGKKIYAYLGSELSFTRDYYVASACDSVFMPPSANLFLTGLQSEVTFYKKFFSKFGVQAEFLHIGKYKNAPDTYTRESMSPEQRFVLQNFLDQYYRDIIRTIADSRNIDTVRVEELINDISGFTGNEALEEGLIDDVAYLSDVENRFAIEDKTPESLSAEDYAQIPASSLKIRNKSKIAVVNCVGTIFSGSETEDPVFGKVLGASTIVRDLEKAAESSSIKAIILRIDSPGGSASAADAIWAAVKKASEKKPVVASVSDYGASGGYYIAMAADTMIVTPNSLVGSIGIFAGKFNIAGLYDKLDLKNETVSIGKNAGLFSVMQPWSDSERAVIERLIRNFYNDFVQKVADARGLSFDAVHALAQGRVWTGMEAVQVGLFDTTGSFYTAVDAAKKLAKIDANESVRLVYYPKEKSILSEVFGMMHSSVRYLMDGRMFFASQVLDHLQMIQNKPLLLLPMRIDWK